VGVSRGLLAKNFLKKKKIFPLLSEQKKELHFKSIDYQYPSNNDSDKSHPFMADISANFGEKSHKSFICSDFLGKNPKG